MHNQEVLLCPKNLQVFILSSVKINVCKCDTTNYYVWIAILNHYSEKVHKFGSTLKPERVSLLFSKSGMVLEGLDFAGLFPWMSLFNGLAPFLAGLAFFLL